MKKARGVSMFGISWQWARVRFGLLTRVIERPYDLPVWLRRSRRRRTRVT